jgi:hypothetical protein
MNVTRDLNSFACNFGQKNESQIIYSPYISLFKPGISLLDTADSGGGLTVLGIYTADSGGGLTED